MAHPALPRYVTVARAALLLGVSPRAVRQLVREGQIEAEGRVHLRISLREVERYLGAEVTLERWTESNERYERLQEDARRYEAQRLYKKETRDEHHTTNA
jgi:excisionase family DNA binding protein